MVMMRLNERNFLFLLDFVCFNFILFLFLRIFRSVDESETENIETEIRTEECFIVYIHYSKVIWNEEKNLTLRFTPTNLNSELRNSIW